MDFVWSPWRYHYIRANADGVHSPEGCVFCLAPRAEDLRSTLVVERGERCYVILNLYPYTSGHVMVVPYEHASSLTDIDDATSNEIMLLVRRTQGVLDAVYRPDGYNIGMNLGKSAGAGIDQHLHMHVVPRWVGDANFVSVIGETRVIPEDLSVTYDKLVRCFADCR
ncbi:MAG TPA: HIT domain-containing protein [Blastocatellia bacterium]|nr:HIT domain-containing protein [Blastocatellia bacterium]